MVRIVLIGCSSKKLDYKAKAENLYISSLFKLSLQYARSLSPDQILVLSAKHHLLGLEDEVEPYDKSLNHMSCEEVKEWSEVVIGQLEEKVDLEKDHFIFLAGEKYRKYLTHQYIILKFL